jgi:hypothetical protein
MAVPQDDIKAAATGKGPPNAKESVRGTPNILERFNKSKLAGPAADKDQVPPLVKEAKAFALYLNPPPPPEQKKPEPMQLPGLPVSGIGPRGSSNQFKLIATCVNQSNPQLSLALIDLPGEGFKWVRQSSKVGHLVIKEIKDSLLVVQDSQRAFDVPIEPRPQQVSLVKGKSLVSSAFGGPMQTPTASELFAPFTPVETTQISGQDESAITQTSQQNTTPAVSKPKPLTAEEEAFAQKFMNEIDSIIVNSGTDEAALEESMKKVDELKKKYFSDTGEIKADGQQTPKKDDSSKKLDKPTPNTNDPNLTRRQPPRRRPPLTRSPVR